MRLPVPAMASYRASQGVRTWQLNSSQGWLRRVWRIIAARSGSGPPGRTRRGLLQQGRSAVFQPVVVQHAGFKIVNCNNYVLAASTLVESAIPASEYDAITLLRQKFVDG